MSGPPAGSSTPAPDPDGAGAVLSIGNFDGVHIGHRAILARARSIADKAAAGGARPRVVALSFFPHPATVLRSGDEPALLTPFDERAALLREAGADEAVRLEPDAALLSQAPEAFVEGLVERWAPRAIVEGPDFRFGRGRAGDAACLRRLGDRHGFETHVVPPVEVGLTDQLLVRASSTAARWLVGLGRVADAALVLGRPHRLVGEVVRGDRLGRTIGFPTANLRTPVLPPADGVYAGVARLPGGLRRPAAVHVGPRATFDAAARSVEAYVLDWTGPDLGAGEPEYGWPLTIELTAWLRDQAKFDGVGPLVAQIERDAARTRALA